MRPLGLVVMDLLVLRELQASRELADQAQASRLSDLRAYLETEMKGVGEHAFAIERDTQARLEKLEVYLGTPVEQSGELAGSLYR